MPLAPVGMGPCLIPGTPLDYCSVPCVPRSTAAVLARVPGFRAQLASWLQRGLGTQPVSPAQTAQAGGMPGVMRGAVTAAGSSPANVRWEASLLSREERGAEAATVVGTRWASPAAVHA